MQEGRRFSPTQRPHSDRDHRRLHRSHRVRPVQPLVGLWDGERESEPSWKDVLLDLKSRGLVHGPVVAIGDGALGFWKALRHVYGRL